jgi:hypothetical protein
MTDKIITILTQFGIGGAVLWVGYVIAMKLIDKWALGDAARTAAIEAGFRSITESHERVLDRIEATHAAIIARVDSNNVLMLQQVHILAIGVNRLDAKISHHFDLTPPPQTIPPPMPSSVFVDPSAFGDKDDTPVDKPSTGVPQQKVKTPPKGVQTGVYGLSQKPPRPKTSG